MKTKTLFFIKILMTCVIGTILYFSVDWGHVFKNLQNLSFFTLTMSLGLLSFTCVFLSYRTKILLKTLDFSISFKGSLVLAVVGHGLNQLMPGVVGGDFYRGLALHQRGLSLKKSVSILLTDRLIGLFTLGCMSLIGGILYLETLLKSPLGEVIILSLFSIALFSFSLFFVSFLPNHVFHKKFLKPLSSVHQSLAALRNYPKWFLKAFAASILIHGCLVVFYWILALDLRISLNITHLLLVLPLSFFLSALPISFAGWGLRESSMILGLGIFGVSKEDALVLAMIYGVLQIVLAIPCLAYGVMSKETLLLKKKPV